MDLKLCSAIAVNCGSTREMCLSHFIGIWPGPFHVARGGVEACCVFEIRVYGKCLLMVISFSFRLALYVYEYLLHVGAQKAAQTFLSEVRCICFSFRSEWTRPVVDLLVSPGDFRLISVREVYFGLYNFF